MSAPNVKVLQRAAELFDALIDLSSSERAERVSALESEPEVQAALQRLLRAHERVVGQTGGHVVAAVGAELREFAHTHDGLAEGTTVGPFQIVRQLGEGGMGQVYLGVREVDGRQQQVAIKLPNRRAAPAAMARFRQERAILASLDHPAIARLVDVGDSAERPYLAMEFVAGDSIDAYCEQRRVTAPERVRKVLTLLAGLQYAHERLVVHRDIKAANVLVDTSGQPRILDFGIGKALDDAAPSTADGQRYFSLACAAPEQIRGLPSSAATDVYAVAVLLYELLCGAVPLEFAELSVPDALERAMQQLPPLASQRFAALPAAEQARIASARQTTPTQLLRFLKNDIDLVLARALRKEPQRRYATAQAFADDLQAVLQSRPIDARRGERWYRTRRFLGRHRLAVSLVGVTTATIIASMVALWLQAENLRVARDTAQARQLESERVVEFLRGLFRQADPVVARGKDMTAKDLVARGIADIDVALKNEPAVRVRLLTILAGIQLSLGEAQEAQRMAEEALAAAQTDDGREQGHFLLARIAFSTGAYDRAIEHADAITRAEAPSMELSDRAFHALVFKISARMAQGAVADGAQQMEALLAEAERRFGENSAEARALRIRLALAFGALGDKEKRRALLEDFALDGDSEDPSLAKLALQRASVERDQGSLDEARRLARWALDVITRVYGGNHAELTHALGRLGSIEMAAGKLDDAQRYFESAVDIGEKALPADNPLLAGLRYNLGGFLLSYRNDAAAALPLLKQAFEQTQRGSAPNGVNAMLYAISVAQAYADNNERTAAASHFEFAQKLLEPFGDRGTVTRAKVRAELLCLSPLNDEGRSVVAEAIRLLRDKQPTDSSLPRLIRCLK